MRFAVRVGVCVLMTALPWPVTAQQPSLAISPASGVFADSQRMNLTILLRGAGGLGIVGGRVLLDGNDITGIAVTVFHPVAVADGIAFLSPTVPMSILGLGTHTFEVMLTLSNGAEVRAAAGWQVLRSN